MAKKITKPKKRLMIEIDKASKAILLSVKAELKAEGTHSRPTYSDAIARMETWRKI